MALNVVPRSLDPSPQKFACPFGPRTLVASRYHDAFFVGCKDGSVMVLQKDSDDNYSARRLLRREEAITGVRVLCEFDPESLLLGHNDGSVTRHYWSGQEREEPITLEVASREPVRSVELFAKSHILVAHRDRSCLKATVSPKAQWETSSLSALEKLGVQHFYCLQVGTKADWLLSTEQGKWFYWDGESEITALEIETATPDAPLIQIAACLEQSRTADGLQPAKAIFLATHKGLLRLSLDNRSLKSQHVALPGGAAMPNSVAYAESPDQRFLWCNDLDGRGYLYHSPLAWAFPSFESAFALPTDHGAILGALYFRSASHELILVEACRTDHLVVSRFGLAARQDLPRTDYEALGSRPVMIHGDRGAVIGHLRILQKPREELEGLKEDLPWEKQEDEYILAELFERIGSSAERFRYLLEGLLAAECRLADEVIRRIMSDQDSDRRVYHLRRVVQLWTLTLLGVLHRHKDSRESQYLALMLWLRHRQRLVIDSEDKKAVEVVEHSIRFAKKWGLIEGIARQRDVLTGPIAVLRRQEPAEAEKEFPENNPEALERLVYESLLFERGIDEIASDSSGQMRGRTAWAIAQLPFAGSTLIAVSWRWGGVELFALEANETGWKLELRAILEPKKKTEKKGFYFAPALLRPSEPRRLERMRRLAFGYSRAILLGELQGVTYLISNVTNGEGASEELTIWTLESRGELISESRSSTVSLGGNSLYCLCELGGGQFLAGVNGPEGAKLFHGVLALEGHVRIESFTEREISLDGQPNFLSFTRIRSLAREKKQGESIVVGFEDGRVLLVREGEKTLQVGQLGSPVLALGVRGKREGEAERFRIFAGGEDGTLICWQSLGGDRFPSLWATAEKSPISGLALPSEPMELVLATTRAGDCILFFDQDLGSSYDNETDHPVRIPFRGCRIGRIKLRGSCFAVEPLPAQLLERETENQLHPYLTILTASADGHLRWLGIHAPRYAKEVRKKRYQEIVELWKKVAAKPHQWRLADAVYRAAPSLSRIMVRFLIDTQTEIAARDSTLLSLPRHLRPLWSFADLWPKRGEERNASIQLDLALRRAWQNDDIALYQEITSVALKKLNDSIFRTVQQRKPDCSKEEWLEEKRHVSRLCTHILRVLRQSLRRWIGSDQEEEARARMTVAANLVDGDSVLKIYQEAARELREAELSDINVIGGGEMDSHPFCHIVKQRIEGIRHSLFRRHPLVSIEALRATNLALGRCCFRLCKARGDYSKPTGNQDLREEIEWPVIALFWEQVLFAAARATRSRLRLSDVLAHQFARSFALAIAASPSATLRIVNRMTESQLILDPSSPADMSTPVTLQMDVLEVFGIKIPWWARILYRLVAELPLQGEHPFAALEQRLADRHHPLMADGFDVFEFLEDQQRTEELFGRENSEDLFCMGRVYRVCHFFSTLADALSATARGIDLTKGKLEEIKRGLDSATVERLYGHSRAFWLDRLADLEKCPLPTAESKDRIRPELIMLSSRLAQWAKDSVEDLDGRFRKRTLFQPEYTLFKRMFVRLHAAASDLPQSAALQKNLVLGVLGHHLLEDLDEHVLELAEVATAIAPPNNVTEGESGVAEASLPVAERFSRYLHRRADRAAEIPKNLRTLHSWVQQDMHAFSAKSPDPSLASLILTSLGLKCAESLPLLNFEEAQVFGMVLAELVENHRKYEGESAAAMVIQPVSSPVSTQGGEPIGIYVIFPVDLGHVVGLEEAKELNLQAPLVPKETDARSKGMGLYLVNLFAAGVGWQLAIDSIEKSLAKPTVTFSFVRKVDNGRSSGNR